ncbi:hypothetical protein E8E11_006915 [Didymella keratinophila]|nr:hypothetical protein E8E11_006915 [Didymella keratinophila]
MAEISKKTPQTLAQRPKPAAAEAAPDQKVIAGDSEEAFEDDEIVELDETPSPGPIPTPKSPAPHAHSAPSTTQTAIPGTRRPSIPAITTAQPRIGAKGQITKPTQAKAKKRDDQDSSKKRAGRQKSAKTERSRSSSAAASSMEIDTPKPTEESPAAGARRESIAADAVPASSPPDASSYPFLARPIMPSWYLSVTKQSMDLLERKRPQELAAIDALKACIDRCEKEKSKAKLAKEHNDLRNHVHKAESSLDMDKVKIKKTRILIISGLPRIFSKDNDFPWDLKADAWHLYEKWMNEDFSRDILRGIVTVKGDLRNGDRLDPVYRAKHPRDPKQFGDNGAVLGQWWPSQLCAVRDGIHGAAQGGIYGDKDLGAYSIVLSSGGYHDKDFGDIIEYSGTEGSNFNITAATQSMLTSAKLGNHIRVLRSSQLPKSNKHRPEVGLRYDGLYQIKSYKEINLEKKGYLFHLARVPGQQPIRSGEGPTGRPTVYEIKEYEKCKGRL